METAGLVHEEDDEHEEEVAWNHHQHQHPSRPSAVDWGGRVGGRMG